MRWTGTLDRAVQTPRGRPYKKDWDTLRGIKILFCCCGLRFFSPLRGTNSKTTNYLLSFFFFSAQYPKTWRKISRCGPFETERLKRYQNRFFNSLKVRWVPSSIRYGGPAPPPPGSSLGRGSLCQCVFGRDAWLSLVRKCAKQESNGKEIVAQQKA